jgi:hypothetical protein
MLYRYCVPPQYQFSPDEFKDRDDGPLARSCRMGLIMVNLTEPMKEVRGGRCAEGTVPAGWDAHISHDLVPPHPYRLVLQQAVAKVSLPSLFSSCPSFRFMGNNYVEAMCDKFIEEDRWLKNFAYELPVVSGRSAV